jgi:uncharacterized membrane protein YkoI
MRFGHIAGAVAIALTASSALAQAGYKKELPDSLARRATVTESVAAATAQARVPKGKIQAVELEREKGRLIYSYVIKTAGKRGVDEVNVDAMTGKVVSLEHETPSPDKKRKGAPDTSHARTTR